MIFDIDLLNADTPILVFDTEDEPSDDVATNSALADQPAVNIEHRSHFSMIRVYNDRLFTDLPTSQIVNWDFLKEEYGVDQIEDPLPDSHYAPTHRRAERLEKSIRNTERGRAQHEKDQIIRLLGELQGHDWLRTMGVNGGARLYSTSSACGARKRRGESSKGNVARAEETSDEEDEDDEEQQGTDTDDSDCSEGAASTDDVDMVDIEDTSEGDSGPEGEPPESDVDAAARQLHDEAMERAKYAALASPKRIRGDPPPTMVNLVPREFTSFFEKRHQRDAALNKGRRRGRTVLAWGQPIPDMDEFDFVLPDFCLDEDTLKAHERQKRRDRRQRKQDTTTVNA
ncbi:hypothetical protein NPX13_g7840 [Xylaria arbuscula]|uniref:Something about silencing protein 4 domain-containing protein n=1 Tax=Xylaria arbuscula TaxID=114810 RepID=A0A9W8N9X2_9PEZI|nr:hypothetical protein NPX13_g7840 [Xylaria arbuscula]